MKRLLAACQILNCAIKNHHIFKQRTEDFSGLRALDEASNFACLSYLKMTLNPNLNNLEFYLPDYHFLTTQQSTLSGIEANKLFNFSIWLAMPMI
ncbi:hypothetical protein GSG51_17090 [Vibrio cholerae]|nr:hypothetical protein [Vibrio paracholerae]MEB5521752.1 hypothetical protein [Vibrio cholerae]